MQNLLAMLKQIIVALRRKTSGGNWIAELDGLRLLAILPVVLQHFLERFVRTTALPHANPISDDPLAFFISRGTVGVFLFFAISGFVLGLPWARHFSLGTPLPTLLSFYKRRLTRLEPPYLIWMSVFALVLLMRGAYAPFDLLGHWAASVTYTHGFIFGNHSIINPVAWSLEVEIQFYLLAPFLAKAYFTIPNISARRVGMVGAILIFQLVQAQAGWLFFPAKLTLLGQLPHFLTGFLAADLFLNAQNAKRHSLWDIAALAAYPVMAYTWTTEVWKNMAFEAALFVLLVAAFRGKVFPAILKNSWIAVAGGMCYTIYLTHLPLLEAFTKLTQNWTVGNNFWLTFWLQLPLVLLLVWGFGAVSYLALEKPFMEKNWPKRFRMALTTGKFRKSIAILLMLAGIPIASYAQTFTDSFPRLRALPELQQAALRHAAALKANEIDSKKQALEIEIRRRSWGDWITASGSALYGNGLVAEAKAIDGGILNTSTGRLSTNLNIGVTLKLSASDVWSRNRKTEKERLQAERLMAERDGITQLLNQEVARLYGNLRLALELVEVRAEALENLQLTLAMAEPYFKSGNLAADKYAEVQSKTVAAREQFIRAKAEAEQAATDLRGLTGEEIWIQ